MRATRFLLLAVAISVSIAAGPLHLMLPRALAQEESDVDESAEKERLRQIRGEINKNMRKAEELKAQENKELKALRNTEKKERKVRGQITSLNKREKTLTKDIDTARSDMEQAQLSYEERRQQLALRLRALYKMGRLRQFEYLLASETFVSFYVRLDYLQRIADQDKVLLSAIADDRERIGLAQDKLDQTLGKVQTNKKRKRSERGKLQQLSKEKQSLVASIQNEREAYEAVAAELRQTARQIQRLLAELERQRTGEDILPPYEGRFSSGQSQLPWPVRGDVVGRFGTEKHPKWGTVTFNSGLDIAAPMGADIRAVARGRVDFVSGDYGSYGQLVIMNHGEGYYTLYAHCSTILVARGQEVESGQVIARVGDSGSLKGPILHFEIRNGKKAVNPENWLR